MDETYADDPAWKLRKQDVAKVLGLCDRNEAERLEHLQQDAGTHLNKTSNFAVKPKSAQYGRF